ncbi:MAG: hypothetical protein MI865_04770 [Proteobacteria bacterium]|nr:hypothetical protein [Pseudomonadota bacterium]
MNKSVPYCYLIVSLLLSNFSYAEQCPSPDIIKDRKISREYEWTIDERRTLEDVLAVEKLFSVRIKNQGEFIACYYSGNRGILRLDGKPLKDSCRIQTESGNWKKIEGETVCLDEELSLCIYKIECA